MTVHYRDTAESGKLATHAPCGYHFTLPRKAGLDYNTSWSEESAVPVNCLECLMQRPRRRKIQQWQGAARRR